MASKMILKTLAMCLFSAAVISSPAGQDIVYKEDPEATKRMTLLLKDFDPHPMVHLPVHNVPRARFPVIDMHNHVNDAQGINGERIAPAELIKTMDSANIQTIVILTGMWGD
jgi:hypothetical protein